MTPATPPLLPDPEALQQLPTEQLVAIILEQQRVIEQLRQTVNALQGSLHLNSQTSSKPPSTDLLKKPEKAKSSPQLETGTEAPTSLAGWSTWASGKNP
jgi:transposase